jgi:hypothetical protein
LFSETIVNFVRKKSVECLVVLHTQRLFPLTAATSLNMPGSILTSPCTTLAMSPPRFRFSSYIVDMFASQPYLSVVAKSILILDDVAGDVTSE